MSLQSGLQGASMGASISGGNPYAIAGGAIAGLLELTGGGEQKQPELIKAQRLDKYSTERGTATENGYKYNRSADEQGILDGSNRELNRIVQGGLQIDQQRLQDNQNAFVAARSPQMERNLAQQAQARAASSAVGGTSGSSSDMYKNAMGNMLANEQRAGLQNQAVLGAEQLAQQQLNQQIQQGAFYSGLQQNDFNNQLQSQMAAEGGLNNANATRINFANQNSGISQQQATNSNNANASLFSDISKAGMALNESGAFEKISGLFGSGEPMKLGMTMKPTAPTPYDYLKVTT